jgi:hypothetical protein
MKNFYVSYAYKTEFGIGFGSTIFKNNNGKLALGHASDDIKKNLKTDGVVLLSIIPITEDQVKEYNQYQSKEAV